MHRIILYAIFFSMALPNIILAEIFSGTYSSHILGVAVILRLTQAQSNDVTGTMISDGIEYQLSGQIQGDQVSGLMTGGGEKFQFTAKFERHDLLLTLSDSENYETISFKPLESDVTMNQPKMAAASQEGVVIINGIELSNTQLGDLEGLYGVKPMPGNYWYDATSGLYGVIGFSAYGFMSAGHQFGELDSNASNGDSNVYVNGRHLPQMEWLVWSRLLGYVIQPGRYWLDANGNTGYEGNLTPMENLYLAAQRNAYHGGGSGDKMWSSRFGAGNYDQGNQRGYVSVPGHGPVGYGF